MNGETISPLRRRMIEEVCHAIWGDERDEPDIALRKPKSLPSSLQGRHVIFCGGACERCGR